MTHSSTRPSRARPLHPTLLLGALLAGCAPAETAAPASADPGLVDVHTEDFVTGVEIPRFRLDPSWPRMPDDLIHGQASGLSVDDRDDVWILTRPNSLGGTDLGAAQEPPVAVCCRPAPHVLRFSGATGELLSAWGGPELVPDADGVEQWPSNVHGLFVDSDQTVWIGGNGDGDHVVLGFTEDGEFLTRVGQRLRTAGNMDRETLGNPADVFHDPETGELVIADGYINKRIVVRNSESGTFDTYWGANGVAPDAPSRSGTFDVSQATSTADGGADPESSSFGDIVHCVTKSSDGLYYVCDRRNNRIQVFRRGADGSIELVRNLVIVDGTGGTRTASDIAFSPDETYMYVADMMNGRVWILLRDSYEILGAFGRNGTYPGQFTWLHSVDVDSQGNVYTTEVSSGRRVQKFVRVQ